MENTMTSLKEGHRKRISLLVLPVAFAISMSVSLWAASQTSSDDEVTLANLEERVEAAETAADHLAIAAFYQEQAQEAQKTASKHEAMAQMYKRNTSKVVRSSGALIEHCNKLAADYRTLANNLLALAKEHETKASETK
jgi:hypothetical protein